MMSASIDEVIAELLRFNKAVHDSLTNIENKIGLIHERLNQHADMIELLETDLAMFKDELSQDEEDV